MSGDWWDLAIFFARVWLHQHVKLFLRPHLSFTPSHQFLFLSGLDGLCNSENAAMCVAVSRLVCRSSAYLLPDSSRWLCLSTINWIQFLRQPPFLVIPCLSVESSSPGWTSKTIAWLINADYHKVRLSISWRSSLALSDTLGRPRPTMRHTSITRCCLPSVNVTIDWVFILFHLFSIPTGSLHAHPAPMAAHCNRPHACVYLHSLIVSHMYVFFFFFICYHSYMFLACTLIFYKEWMDDNDCKFPPPPSPTPTLLMTTTTTTTFSTPLNNSTNNDQRWRWQPPPWCW